MGHRVLITGGNKGIGLFISKLFLEKGDTVVIVARDFTNFALADDERVTAIAYDLSDVEGIPALAEKIGDIDILVNNAGMSHNLFPEEYDEKRRLYITNLNLAAPIALTTQYLPHFKASGGGRVVNVASQAGVFGHFDVWYGALKAGLINATKTFANLYGRYGLVINAISPGPVDGDIIRDSPFKKRFDRIIDRTILKRSADPSEVAQVVCWLAKESPIYLNGENYLINNGVTSLEL
ncbi:MAG: SDR family oxidoreductase [Synergistaceae bacterium]|nr:SDR family oxidoreductase [Synergistaceae bacterium]